jgi:hypothetical protein
MEHLLDLALVAPDRTDAAVDVAPERDLASAGPLAHERHRVVDRAREVEVRELQLHPPRLELREIEDVVGAAIDDRLGEGRRVSKPVGPSPWPLPGGERVWEPATGIT